LTPRLKSRFWLAGASLLLLPPLGPVACAQDNHEIQVYPIERPAAGAAMVGLHPITPDWRLRAAAWQGGDERRAA